MLKNIIWLSAKDKSERQKEIDMYEITVDEKGNIICGEEPKPKSPREYLIEQALERIHNRKGETVNK